MRDATLAPQRRCLPRDHLFNKGESEVRWSNNRSWSDTSGRDRPGSHKSNPHASLELQQRRPLRACESLCLMVRLPPGQDVAAMHLALGVLNAVLSLSSPPLIRPTYSHVDRNGSLLFSAVYRSFLQMSRHIRQRGLVRPVFMPGDGNYSHGQPCSNFVAS